MYADEASRGGILEPEGIVNIKYRRDKQLDTMARLDPTYGALRQSLHDKSLSGEELASVKAKMTEREERLLPVYSQVALQFADLHDRAGRMEAKGTIRAALEWKNARRFFYWRLRRRLSEELILKRMASVSTSPPEPRPISPSQSSIPSPPSIRDSNLATLESWAGIPNFDRSDKEVALWYEENKKMVYDKIETMKTDGVADEVAKLLLGNKSGGLKGVQQVLSMLPAAERESVLKYLSTQ